MIDYDDNIDIDNISHTSVKHLFGDEENVFNKEQIKLFPDNLAKTKNTEEYRDISFKNYIPNDENLKIEKLTHFDRIKDIENKYEKKVRKFIKEFINLEKNPLNVVPKKHNSDLKKHLAKKLEKLNKRTEIAILELIKENMAKQKNDTGLIVNTVDIKDYDGEISSDYDKGIND